MKLYNAEYLAHLYCKSKGYDNTEHYGEGTKVLVYKRKIKIHKDNHKPQVYYFPEEPTLEEIKECVDEYLESLPK